MTLSSSAMDRFALCSVHNLHDTHNIFRLHLFSIAFTPFVMFLYRVCCSRLISEWAASFIT